MFYIALYVAFSFVFLCGFVAGSLLQRSKIVSDNVDAVMVEFSDAFDVEQQVAK